MRFTKTAKAFSVLLTLILLCGAVALCTHAEGHEHAHFKDPDGILTASQAAEIEQAILDAMSRSKAKSMPTIYVLLCEYGNNLIVNSRNFLSHYGLTASDDIVLLSVDREWDAWHYYMDRFGTAHDKISEKEMNYILDDKDVHDNLKHSDSFESFKAGVARFTELTLKGYNGRVGAPMFGIIMISLVISLIVGGIACAMVGMKYKMKRQPTNYPLDKYTQMELTDSQDVFVGSYVRKRRIQTSSGGSRGSSGGGSFSGGHQGSR